MITFFKNIIIGIGVLTLLSSCAKKEYLYVETTLELNEEKSDVSSFKQELQRKFLENGFEIAQSSKKIGPNNLVLASKIAEKDLATYKLLFESNKLNIWKTFNLSDELIKGLDTTMLEIDNFVPFYKLESEFLPREALGICRQEKFLEEIVLKLEENLKDLADLKLIWGAAKEAGQEGAFYLYLIHNDPKNPPITENYITDTNVSNTSAGQLAVNFSFDQKGTKQWAEMTTQAAYAGNRSLAIEFNDRILICPRVMGPITGGRCSITGDFSLLEATALSEKIKTGRYSKEFIVLDQTIRKGK